MSLSAKSRTIVFVLTLLVWLAITYPVHWQELMIGSGVSALVAGLSGGILLKTGRSFQVYRFYFFIWYLGILAWQMTRANFQVAYMVIHPELPIQSSFISITTDLKEDTSWTILANSITLTPGTLTVGADKKKRKLFIHCMTVQTADMDKFASELEHTFQPVLRRFMR